MKSALKQIFRGSSHSDSLVGGHGDTVKQETECYTKSGSPHQSSTRRSGFNRSSSGKKREENEEYTTGDKSIGQIQESYKMCNMWICFSHIPHEEDVHEAVCENQEKTRDGNITLLV